MKKIVFSLFLLGLLANNTYADWVLMSERKQYTKKKIHMDNITVTKEMIGVYKKAIDCFNNMKVRFESRIDTYQHFGYIVEAVFPEIEAYSADYPDQISRHNFSCEKD